MPIKYDLHRVSMVKFNIVTIKVVNEDVFFFGKVPSRLPVKGSSLIRNVCEYRGTGKEFVYKKLYEKYLLVGITGMIIRRYDDELDREECDKQIWEMQKDCAAIHGDEAVLNDRIIDPKKVKCDCGMMIREALLESHKSKYCTAKLIPDFGRTVVKLAEQRVSVTGIPYESMAPSQTVIDQLSRSMTGLPTPQVSGFNFNSEFISSAPE